MRVGAAGLLLLAACSSGPIGPFDAGFEVHLLLRADPPPRRPLRVHPVFTVGPEVRKRNGIRYGPDDPAVRELAIVLAPRGKQRISVWEPRTRTDARATVDVQHELWIVVDLGGDLSVYEAPPNDEVGAWEFFEPVPD